MGNQSNHEDREVEEDTDEFSSVVDRKLKKKVLDRLSYDVIIHKIFSCLLFDVMDYLKKFNQQFQSTINVTEFFGYFESDHRRKVFLVFSNFCIGDSLRSNDVVKYSFLPLQDIYGITIRGIVHFGKSYNTILSKAQKLRIFETNKFTSLEPHDLRNLSKNMKKIVLKVDILGFEVYQRYIHTFNRLQNLRFLTFRIKTASVLTNDMFDVSLIPDLDLPRLERLWIDFDTKHSLYTYRGFTAVQTKLTSSFTFTKLPRLRELCSLYGSFNEKQAESISKHCPLLSKFVIRQSIVPGLDLILGGRNNLRVVSLSHIVISECMKNAYELEFHPKSRISEVNLVNVEGLSVELVKKIIGLKELKKLSLSNCNIEKFFFQTFFRRTGADGFKQCSDSTKIDCITLVGNSGNYVNVDDTKAKKKWEIVANNKNFDLLKVVWW